VAAVAVPVRRFFGKKPVLVAWDRGAKPHPTWAAADPARRAWRKHKADAARYREAACVTFNSRFHLMELCLPGQNLHDKSDKVERDITLLHSFLYKSSTIGTLAAL
jgi:hypothetical protein